MRRTPALAALSALSALVVLATACAVRTTSTGVPGAGSASSPVSGVISAVSNSRSALLASITAVQAGAKALDATDRFCAQGTGVPARTASRQGAAQVTAATTAAKRLDEQVASYTKALEALAALQSASPQAPAAVRTSLAQVVTTGQAEAQAAGTFAKATDRAWPQYLTLDITERTWIHRAVTPWYRTTSEGADAYAVLLVGHRDGITTAHAVLAQASAQVIGPANAQTAQLRAADAALARARA